jgi:hypothetical protein
MSLYISMRTPSAELAKSPIDQAITFLAVHAAIDKRLGRLPAGPAIDVTFMLPGAKEVPPFQGMRMGGYSADGGTLFFEAAVPAHIARSSDAPRYVAVIMQDVVDNASQFFKDNAIPFDEQEWFRAVTRLALPSAVAEHSH